MERAVLAAECAFGGTLHDADEAVQTAMRMARDASRPVVIADAQDNPGAGGSSDTTGVLRALIRHGARDAAIGLIVDPAARRASRGRGQHGADCIGWTLGYSRRCAAGGRIPGRKTSDGRFDTHGAFYRGFHMDLGPSACLSLGGVRIVVASNKVQMADQEMFRFAGVDPARAAILVVKSSAHFRADFTSIAHAILVCAAPGSMLMDAAKQPWTRLRPGIRMAPCGPAFSSRPGNA